MHRLAATPGGWTPNTQGVIFVEQTPAPLIFLTPADTDIQLLGAALSHLPPTYPSLRAVNLLNLQQQLSIDHYLEKTLVHAQVIILRLLGGREYWSYGLEVTKELVETTGANLLVMPGDNIPDSQLMSHSTIPIHQVYQVWRYFTEGGLENWINGLKLVSDFCWQTSYQPLSPEAVPAIGRYCWPELGYPKVGILFYRSHYLAGNTLPIDALCRELNQQQLDVIPVFISSLRDPSIQTALTDYFTDIQLLFSTTSFALAQFDSLSTDEIIWHQLDVPIFQLIFSSSTREQWQENFQGLTAKDIGMNVALPEVDGKIITRAVSFKSVVTWHPDLETDIVIYQPESDRITWVVQLAKNWVTLRQTPPENRKLAIIFANYPNRDGRLANAVGLDTPASCLEILRALQAAGYHLENIPDDSDELMRRLTQGVTNDPEGREMRAVYQAVNLQDYQRYLSTLPPANQKAISQRWPLPTSLPIPGIQLGNIFIGIQPPRGYDQDPSLNYHAADLEPTADYLAYYYWLKVHFQASAIIHLGKHGNLEWLPGKGVALSANCYPEIALGTLPNFYPFIVNDPGEGTQAKRRAHAVILDHLTPPLTRAELYGELAQLESLIDEYYDAQSLDPSRLPSISDRLLKLLQKTHLHQDLGLSQVTADSLQLMDAYLCELKEAQIRDGLHIFGCPPTGEQLIDLLIAIARSPSSDHCGFTRAIAQDLQLDFDPLSAPAADQTTALEHSAKQILQTFTCPPHFLHTQTVLTWIKTLLLPAIQETTQEISNLLKGLNGQYVPPGPSGAPTRGRPEVLPTGRNFYAADSRAMPTPTAWDVGRKAAEALIERYTQENGEYPRQLALSIWGTSTMRTGGDDVAQVLALLGVQPVWDSACRRVTGYEILSPSVLGRPRVDVTLRISGFFRDGFPNVVSFLYNAIKEVACQEEAAEINPLRAQVETDRAFWLNQGLTEELAEQKATYRIFGSKPGAYGTGLQGLIESQNWQTDEDLAKAYINWSSYAYDAQAQGHLESEILQGRLKQLQVILHNQDNREHDIFDSDDYYQFQGGLAVAVRSLTGKNPTLYFGDNSRPENPQVRLLKTEINRVYRSRVINPKWIRGMMRHGYKGAFEMAATLDYVFAYDVTTRCVEDFMYQGIAEAYLFDEEVQQFIENKNPWALRDLAERLLEARKRQLWQNVEETTIEQLRAIVHRAEGMIENRF